MNENLNDYINELLKKAWNEAEEPSKDELRKSYLKGVEDALTNIEAWIEEHKIDMEAPNGNIYTMVEVN